MDKNQITYVYHLSFEDSESVYVGITNNINKRLLEHRRMANKGANTPLYNCMRKHTPVFRLYKECSSREEACEWEKYLIMMLRKSGAKLLNIADGGDGGWVVRDKEEWLKKMKKARNGKKPALGMKHSDENKELFRKVSREYWDSQETYDPREVLTLPHREAKEKFGISTTHYYRLRKKAIEEGYFDEIEKKY